MEIPVEIVWHNMDPAHHVEARVKERAARLEKFFGRIIRCYVVVEAAHRRHQKGNQYEVRMDVTVPGGEISVSRRPGNDHAHEDVLVTIRDAFDAMERKLRRWKDGHSGRPVAHEAPLQGRITEIDADAGSGQIATTDGRSIYFHRNALVAGAFEELSEGDTVELVVDPGEDAAGAHASTVRPIGGQRFVDRPA